MSLRQIVVGLAIVVTIGACALSPSSSPSAFVATPSATVPTPTAGRFPTPEPTPPAIVAVDRALLDVLPATIAGLTIEPSPEGEADAASDPGLAALADAFAAAIAVDPQSGDFVFAAVVAVRAGIVTDALFRDWRDSYDEGACSQAGGVTGHAEAAIGGRTVFIGSCAGGLHTYHAWLEDRDLLVSASSIGDGRLGERLMEGLR